jgi:iron(III) transport system permease protein
MTEGRAWWGSRRSRAPPGPAAAGWVLLALVVGYLVLLPVLQLQWKAFVDSGSAFGRMMELPRIGTTIQTTIVLAILSSVLAV